MGLHPCSFWAALCAKMNPKDWGLDVMLLMPGSQVEQYNQQKSPQLAALKLYSWWHTTRRPFPPYHHQHPTHPWTRWTAEK